MIELDPTRFRVPSFEHQLEDTRRLIRSAAVAQWSQTGTGKTKSVIDAACALYEAGEIDTVLVVCPAGAKSVWCDPDLGQIARYAWVFCWVTEHDARNRELCFDGEGLDWVVTSYEFVRTVANLKKLRKQLKGRKIWIVADESWAIESHRAAQTKACYELAEISRRRTILNGTPINHWLRAPIKYFSQFYFLNPEILGKNFYAYRNRYCVMGGFKGKNVVGAQNVDELNQRMAPNIIRRLKSECLDLPPKLNTQLEVPLGAETWRLYQEMRDDLVAYLSRTKVATASIAAVKGLRLAQLTSGFAGGIQLVYGDDTVCKCGASFEDHSFADNHSFTPDIEAQEADDSTLIDFHGVREISREKRAGVFNQIATLELERSLIWCRFRPDIDRLYEEAKGSKDFKGFKLHKIYAQPRAERQAAKVEAEVGSGPCLIFANPAAGGVALQMTTFSYVFYLSQDWSLNKRLQSEDRTHRIGQFNPCTYCDVLATGPSGQKTVDHAVTKAFRAGEDLAAWTTQRWRDVLATGEI